MHVSTGSNVALWASAAFHDQARSWVATVSHDRGVELDGEMDQPHNRPWSSAIRFGSSAGDLWFKVNGPGTRHESTLVGLLAELVPDLVADVLAVDADRGWTLTRDAGPMLRTTAPPEQLWSRWEGIVQRYAEAQILLGSHDRELLGTGTPEVSPRTMPGQAAALLEQLAAETPDTGGLTAEQAEGLTARLPEYAGWCAELTGSGIPESVQHDDLHSGNICWAGSLDRARIIDWGDASVGHPFGTMLCTLNSVSHAAGLELDDPRVLRVRDAYLEPFTAFADHAELVRLVALARRTGCVARALSYRAALLGESDSTHAEYEFPVREWFLDLLED